MWNFMRMCFSTVKNIWDRSNVEPYKNVFCYFYSSIFCINKTFWITCIIYFYWNIQLQLKLLEIYLLWKVMWFCLSCHSYNSYPKPIPHTGHAYFIFLYALYYINSSWFSVCSPLIVFIIPLLNTMYILLNPYKMCFRTSNLKIIWLGSSGSSQGTRPEGAGIGMGNTCNFMADSCQCMTKPTTIL